MQIDENTEYDIERVLKRRTIKGGKKQCYVKWKGWDKSYNSWVDKSEIDNYI